MPSIFDDDEPCSNSSNSAPAKNPPDLPPYQYDPLEFADSVRFIEIYADDTSEWIICSIHQLRLSENPAYEAVSYTWGDSTDRRIIMIQCGPRIHGISVTANCESVIRKMRQQTGTRRIWIDAICIDQQNIPEKNLQVAMMGQIYQNASRVVVDIGDREEPAHKEFRDLLMK